MKKQRTTTKVTNTLS